MTFNKPTEWGCRFSFPENAKLEFNPVNPIVRELSAVMAEQYDDAVVEVIAETAKAAGITDLAVLNKTAILAAIEKQIPQKPERAIFHNDELWKKLYFDVRNAPSAFLW